MKRWMTVVVLGAGVMMAAAPAGAAVKQRPKDKVEHRTAACRELHKLSPKAVELCEKHGGEHRREVEDAKPVAESQELFHVKLTGGALAAAIELEKKLGAPLVLTIVEAAETGVDAKDYRAEILAKMAEVAPPIREKAKASIDPFLAQARDEMAKLVKESEAQLAKDLDAVPSAVDKQLERMKKKPKDVYAWKQEQIKRERAAIVRRHNKRLEEIIDKQLRALEAKIEPEVHAKATEIDAAERAKWQPKALDAITAKTHVNMADLSVIHDAFWQHLSQALHHSRPTIEALLAREVFKGFEAELRRNLKEVPPEA